MRALETRLFTRLATVAVLAMMPLVTASAAPPLLLPPSAVHSEARTKIYVLAVDDSGQPVRGLTLRGSAALGTLSDAREVGDGLYAFVYTSPRVTQSTTVSFEVRGKGPSRQTIQLTGSVTVNPAAQGDLQITVNPEALVLGDDSSAALSLILPEGAQPSVKASFGTVDTLTPLGEGRWSARYIPRAVNFPHVAVVGVINERDEQAQVVSIPMSGKVQFPVAAPEGATVLLRIGDREYGPVRSNADGVALVPIVVPPGVNIATQVVVIDGQVTETALDLAIPASRRVSLLPLPSSVPAGSQVTVYAAVVEPTGEMDGVTLPRLVASSGTIGPARRVSPGLVAADWTVGSSAEDAATVTVSIDGEEDQRHQVAVAVLAGRPMGIEVSHDPIDGSGPLPIEVIVRDPEDRAASGYTVSVLGGDPVTLSDGGRGNYRGLVNITPASRDQLVTVTTPATGLPPASLALSVPRRTVAPNSTLPVAVVALDRYGVPVPGVVVELEVAEGGGRIERTLATGDSGVAMARYRTPQTESAVRIVAKTGDVRSTLVLAQVIADASVDMPPMPPDEAADRWRSTSAWLGSPAETPAAVAVVDDPIDSPATPDVVPAPKQGFDNDVRIRLGFVGSSYSYVQDPIGDGGPLIDETVIVGTDRGDSSAKPIGFEASTRSHFGAFPYIGLDATFRNTWYGVTASEFEGAVARDALQYLHGALVFRLPVRVRDNAVVHGGLRVGGEYSDFIYFTGDVEARQVEYTTLQIPSLSLGGEVGIDVGRVYGVLSFDGSLAYARDVYAGRLELEGGVDLTDSLFLSAGFGRTARSFIITGNSSGDELGELTDRLWHGQVGLGLSL